MNQHLHALAPGLDLPPGLKKAYEGLRRDPYLNWNIEGWDMAIEREPPKNLKAWNWLKRSLSSFYRGTRYAGSTYEVTKVGEISVHRAPAGLT